MDMVERVARAIAGHFGPDLDDLPRDKAEWKRRFRSGDTLTGDTQQDVLDAARAAIDAMREPSEGMVEAMKTTMIEETLYSAYGEVAVDCYKAAIDAALGR